MESRFSRRASVGLIVRAPRPPWCIVDCLLLLLPEDGVAPLCAAVRPGEAPENEVAVAFTGVVILGFNRPCEVFRDGGCKDFVRAVRAAVARRGAS